MSSDERRTQVLCIAGAGRSGSTILDTVLGQIEGVFSCGELWRLFDHGVHVRWPCGCGEVLSECPVWTRILTAAFGDERDEAMDRIRFLRDRWRTPRARWALTLPGGERRMRARFREYLELLDRLYRAIAETTGCHVIVDSSKIPWHLRSTFLLPSVDAYVVHLVRDPRATAWSWQRKRRLPLHDKEAYMRQLSASRAALAWNARALSAAALCRRRPGRAMTLRYEDFARDPRRAIDRIATLLERPLATPVTEEGRVWMGPTHSVSGNPGRLQSGAVEIRMDDEWKERMRPLDRTLVAALTWPLLVRYGYASAGRRLTPP
jgi:hypothetical protein